MTLSATQNIFLQIGATRDGFDPYLDATWRRGMKAILIETPDYIEWRRNLGRRSFDIQLPVAQPSDPNQVLRALGDLCNNLKLVLPGFERYVECAYTIAEILNISPWKGTARPHFVPPNKWDQRRLLSKRASCVLQPTYIMLSAHDFETVLSTDLKYPLVIKPVNGGGGLGVFLVETPSQLQTSLTELRKLTNYDGSFFDKIILEEYVSGVEYSVQGLSWKGTAVILTVCEKFIFKEYISEINNLYGFREVGHMAASGSHMTNPEFQQLTQSCLNAFGYYEGPFHIDMIQNSTGIYFVEMGFRLSGNAVVNLVKKLTGIDWAEVSFACHLEEAQSPVQFISSKTNNGFIGQIAAVSPEELKMGEHLRSLGLPIEIEKFSPPKRSFNLTASSPGSLAADFMRTTGSLGRITVSASSLTEVRQILQKCAPIRLAPQATL